MDLFKESCSDSKVGPLMSIVSSKVREITRSWWGVMVVGALSGIIIFQQWQITHPNARRQILLRAGDQVAQVGLTTLDGQPETLSWDGRSTILYIFSPDCVYCKKNLTLMQALANDSKEKYRFIGISLKEEGLVNYVKRNNLRYTVLLAKSGSLGRQQLKLGPTPETILISDKGTVKDVWLGMYSGRVRKGIEAAFALQLPPEEVAQSSSRIGAVSINR